MKFYHRGVRKHGRGNQCLKQTVFEYETMNVKKDEDLSRVLKCKQIKKDVQELSCETLKRKAQQIRYRIQSK